METVLMPFLMSMLLGRTIDLSTYYIGGDVYDAAQYDEIAVNKVDTNYMILEDSTSLYNFIGIPIDLALRIKSGYISSSSGSIGLDGLLRDTAWKQRSVTVAVGTAVQTVQRTLKEDATPLPNWTTRISSSQTHYANSIMYGGWSVILYRFKCDIPGDVEIVRKTLTETLGIRGLLEPDTIKLWQKAVHAISRNREIRGRVDVHINSYSTFPFKHNLTSSTGLLSAIEEIPKLVGPVGKPLLMKLLPLHEMDPKYPVVRENHVLDKELEQMLEMYDDVKNTKNSINHWVEETDSIFSDEDEEKITNLLAHLNACLKLFHQVASEASVYSEMDPNLLKSAVDLYNSELTNYAYTYDRIYRRLKEDIDKECQDTFFHKIKGLLEVDDTERIQVGKVEDGLEECKSACLAAPNCRSIGYVDRMISVEKIGKNYKLIGKEKLCYVYFRSTSTANVIPPFGASVTGVYDRKCS